MARTVAALPEGSRITDYVSLGVISKTFPPSRVWLGLGASRARADRLADVVFNVEKSKVPTADLVSAFPSTK